MLLQHLDSNSLFVIFPYQAGKLTSMTVERHSADHSSDHVSSNSPDWSAEDPLSSSGSKPTPPESPLSGDNPSPPNGIRVPPSTPEPCASPTPSPKYVPGCFTLAKLKMKSPEPDNDQEIRDPLALRMRFDSEDCNGTSNVDRLLEVSLKNRDAAQRRDLDHLIGVIAREMKKIKEYSGAMPRYRCSGTRFSGRNIHFKFPNNSFVS